MKIVYTILFFADTGLLIALSFLLLRLLDAGKKGGPVLALLMAILISVGLLVYFLDKYTKLPLKYRR